jgi:hypothetical protein
MARWKKEGSMTVKILELRTSHRLREAMNNGASLFWRYRREGSSIFCGYFQNCYIIRRH